jgi:hypothetical protein
MPGEEMDVGPRRTEIGRGPALLAEGQGVTASGVFCLEQLDREDPCRDDGHALPDD